MKPWFKRTSNILMTINTILGILLSMAGLGVVWVYHGRVLTSVQDGLDLAARSVDSTNNMLSVVGSSLGQARDGLETVEKAARDVGETLDATSGITDSIGSMMGVDMVAVVGDAQTALSSMQQSALLIDDTLRVISGIPLIGKRYKPDVTLHDSIGDLSRSLEPVPVSLTGIQTDMAQATRNLDAVQTSLDDLAGSLTGIESDLTDASGIVIEYQDILTDIGDGIDGAKSSAGLVVTGLAVLLSLFFVWMLLTQVTMYFQARQLAEMEKGEGE